MRMRCYLTCSDRNKNFYTPSYSRSIWKLHGFMTILQNNLTKILNLFNSIQSSVGRGNEKLLWPLRQLFSTLYRLRFYWWTCGGQGQLRHPPDGHQSLDRDQRQEMLWRRPAGKHRFFEQIAHGHSFVKSNGSKSLKSLLKKERMNEE